MLLYTGFIATWAVFILAPILTGVVVWRRREGNRAEVKMMALCSAAFLLGFGLCYWTGLQTSITAFNFAACLAAFVAYSFLISSLWIIRPRFVGVPLGALGSITLIPTYLLATVGVLALVFIIGDYLSPPLHEEEIRPGLSCIVLGWGAVFSDEGYDVHLYKHLPWFPLVRKEIIKVRVDETNPGSGPAKATCADVAANVRQ